MAFTRLGNGSLRRQPARQRGPGGRRGGADRGRAGRHRWAEGTPLILGGDFNLRPALSGHVFDALSAELRPRGADRRAGSSTTCSSRGLDVIEAPAQWPPERREVPDPTAASGTATGAADPPLRPRSGQSARFGTPRAQ